MQRETAFLQSMYQQQKQNFSFFNFDIIAIVLGVHEMQIWISRGHSISCLKSYYFNIDKYFQICHDYLELISHLILLLETQIFFYVHNWSLTSGIKSQFAQKLSHITPFLCHFINMKHFVTWNERLFTYHGWKYTSIFCESKYLKITKLDFSWIQL